MLAGTGPIAPMAAIIMRSQPDPWVRDYLGSHEGEQPYGARKLNPSLTAVQVDNPPTLLRQPQPTQPDAPFPQSQRYRAQVTAVQPCLERCGVVDRGSARTATVFALAGYCASATSAGSKPTRC
jgi:hypothetical protein